MVLKKIQAAFSRCQLHFLPRHNATDKLLKKDRTRKVFWWDQFLKLCSTGSGDQMAKGTESRGTLSPQCLSYPSALHFCHLLIEIYTHTHSVSHTLTRTHNLTHICIYIGTLDRFVYLEFGEFSIQFYQPEL